MTDFIWFGLVGLAMGLIASTLRQGDAFSLMGDMAVGVLGALMGEFLFRFVNTDGEGLPSSLAAAAAGATLLVFDLWLIQKRYAEQLFRRVLWRGNSPASSHGPLPSHLPGPDRRHCQICGQRHLL